MDSRITTCRQNLISTGHLRPLHVVESACNEVVGGRNKIRYMREFVIAVKRLNSVPLCHQGAPCTRVWSNVLTSKGQRSHKAKNRRKHFWRSYTSSQINLVAVLVSGLWAMAGDKWHSRFNNGRHLECAIQTELVVELELALIERMQCRRFAILSYARKIRKGLVGWHCAKVKGHAELKRKI